MSGLNNQTVFFCIFGDLVRLNRKWLNWKILHSKEFNLLCLSVPVSKPKTIFCSWKPWVTFCFLSIFDRITSSDLSSIYSIHFSCLPDNYDITHLTWPRHRRAPYPGNAYLWSLEMKVNDILDVLFWVFERAISWWTDEAAIKRSKGECWKPERKYWEAMMLIHQDIFTERLHRQEVKSSRQTLLIFL